MPRRRLPGHLNRRARRRDSGPNLPAGSNSESIDASEPTAHGDGQATPRLRPTLRQRGAPAARQTPLTFDYAYVAQDMRHIGILTALGLAVLLGLTFVIR